MLMIFLNRLIIIKVRLSSGDLFITVNHVWETLLGSPFNRTVEFPKKKSFQFNVFNVLYRTVI